MHFEDLRSYALRNDQMIEEFYNKGQRDLLNQLAKDLSSSFGAKFNPKYEEIIEKLGRLASSKDNLSIIKTVECHVSDLYRLLKDTQRIIQMVEDGISNAGRIKLKKFKLNVRVTPDEVLDSIKDEIVNMFNSSLNEELSNEVTQYITALKRELSEMSGKTSDFIGKDQDRDEEFCFIEPFECEPNIQYLPLRSALSMSTNEIISVKYQRQQKQMLKEKEWENKEIKLLKQKYKSKKQILKLKKTEQQETENYLKKKNLEITKEKAEIERIRENYYREKKKIMNNYENKSRKLSEVINELTVTVENPETVGKISPITETEMMSDISFTSDLDASFDSSIGEPDLNSIQRRISELESQFKSESSSEIQERLKRDIDCLKNSYTNLRSAQVLRNSNSNQKRFNFNRNISLTDITGKRSTPVSISTPKPRLSINSSRPLFRTTATPKSASQHFTFSDIAPVIGEENELKKYLRAKEVKLSEKEERFEKERDYWIQKWNKLPNANELIPMVQKEIMEFKRKRDDFDKKDKELDMKELSLEAKENELRRKEVEISQKLREIEESKSKVDDEKSSLVERLSKLREDLER